MNKQKAERLEEVARQRFVELIGNNPVPASDAERLSIGRISRADGLTVRVSLLPEGELSDEGHLVDDLSQNIEICRLDVNGDTEEVTVTMVNVVPWLTVDGAVKMG